MLRINSVTCRPYCRLSGCVPVYSLNYNTAHNTVCENSCDCFSNPRWATQNWVVVFNCCESHTFVFTNQNLVNLLSSADAWQANRGSFHRLYYGCNSGCTQATLLWNPSHPFQCNIYHGPVSSDQKGNKSSTYCIFWPITCTVYYPHKHNNVNFSKKSCCIAHTDR